MQLANWSSWLFGWCCRMRRSLSASLTFPSALTSVRLPAGKRHQIVVTANLRNTVSGNKTGYFSLIAFRNFDLSKWHFEGFPVRGVLETRGYKVKFQTQTVKGGPIIL